jgi:hypothetical protein
MHLLRYLTSEEMAQKEDQGLSIFLMLYNSVSDLLDRTHTGDDGKINVGEVETEETVHSEGGGSFSGGLRAAPTAKQPLQSLDSRRAVPSSSDISHAKNPMQSNTRLNDPQLIQPSTKDRPLFDFQKLKDFKIHGTIGGAKKENDLKFSSLKCQIEYGRKHYKEEQILAGVMNAIAAGSNLKGYLETKENLTVESLLNILGSHFHEKDSSAAFTELATASQGKDQTAYDFCMSVLILRQSVLTLSREEGCPYNIQLLNKRFLDTLDTGLRNPNIRSELRPLTSFDANRRGLVSDEELLKAVSQAMANEAERTKKHAGASDVDAAVNALQQDSTRRSRRENPLQAELKKRDDEIAALKGDLCEIKTALNALRQPAAPAAQRGVNWADLQDDSILRGGQGRGGNRDRRGMSWRGRGRGGRSSRGRCRECVRDNVQERCNHCFRCRSTEHQVQDCDQECPNE